jgi:hypothetical protein
MAVKVSGVIIPQSGSYVAQAENIAFTEGGTAVSLQLKLATLAQDVADLASTAVKGTADDIIYEGSTTIKQKIASLENNLGTTADRIAYSYDNNGETVTTNVKAVLDSLRSALDGISDLDTKTENIRQYAERAENAAAVAEAYQRILTASVNEKITEATEISNEAKSAVAGASAQIAKLTGIAEQLNSVFEDDGQIQVIGISEYRSLSAAYHAEHPNTVYFCYDDETTETALHTISGVPNNSTMGSVVGGGAYHEGTYATLVALPKNGYVFDHWSDKDSNNQPITDNPRSILMGGGNQAYIAYFVEYTPPANNN